MRGLGQLLANTAAATCVAVAARVSRLLRAKALLFAAVVLAGATWGVAQEASIKVLVNDSPISEYDIDQRERFLAITTQQQPSPALKKQATDMLIDELLQLQEGKRQGATVDEDDVKTVLGDMAQKNNLDVEGLSTALGRAGVNIKTLKDRIRAQIVWQDAVRRKFRHEVNINEADVTAALTEAGTPEGDDSGQVEPALQLRQVRFEVPAGANQATLAAKLAAAESLRSRFSSCADLAKGVNGATVKTLQDQKPASLVQPARLLVANAKVGQMTPPTIATSAVELYAVCGKRTVAGDDKVRLETQRKLMSQEMALRAERLLRDLKGEAFIEYR
ncbi:MAG TPA: SurA N-terminal domain-containing protein [Methyloceanibacter sp.]|nr:SurA N-terminal domain-containing protein [Methyloceanibacter sp.]